MIRPKLSVILPVHNAEEYLRQTIDSILFQTFNNFELIVVDDGSTDSSSQIISSYDDTRIVYIKNETNLRLVATLNKGIAAAKGEYIARIDADDRCLPTRFQKQLDFLESHRNIDLCGSWANLIGPDGRRIGRIKNVCDNRLLSCLLLFTCPLVHPSVMGKASIFKENPYDASMLHIEDLELWSRLSSKDIGIANIPEYLIDYRWHDSNISVVNEEVQYKAKSDLLRIRLSELLGRVPSNEEMRLHLCSFNLYDKGRRRADEKSSFDLNDEKRWFILLSENNGRIGMFDRSDLNAVLLSRWIVCCIALHKYTRAFSLPLRFYSPLSVLKAITLLLQK